jgi:sterol desaturase/sphingolipid hydroxylase (fatty acid hydroxylase superfamily)
VKPQWRAGLVFIGMAAPLALCGDAMAEVAGEVPEQTAAALKVLLGGVAQAGLVAGIALPLQYLLPAVRRRPKVLSYEYWLDVLYWCQAAWLLPVAFFAAVGWVVRAAYGGSGPWFPALAGLPYWAQVALAVWAFDFVVYWRHRLEHRLAVLWSFHAVHHTAEQVDVLTASRIHPFELALGVVTNAAVVRLGLDPAATALGFTIYLNYNYFIHTNVRIRFRGPLRYVLVSPFMHQWHHAKEADAMGKNVGVVFAWNDWLFGTAHHPDRWPTEYGLAVPAPERVGQSYLRQLVYPFQYGLARLRARRTTTAGVAQET